MQEFPSPAMERVATDSNAWTTLLPLTYPAEILAGSREQEDVGAVTNALSLTLKSPAMTGELSQVELVVDRDQEIRVFRISLGRGQGSDERDLADAWRTGHFTDKL